MKFAILGAGSIGTKYVQILKNLDHEIVVWNRGHERLKIIKTKYKIRTYSSKIKMFKEFKPEVTLICTPNNCHISDSLLAAYYDSNVFVEKPLSNNLRNLDKLNKLLNYKKLISHVGCNLRFHYGPRKIKLLIESNFIGRIIWGNFFVSSYLPDWHKDEDYRKMYSAKKKLGGGVILDCIHEIDLIYWFFGIPNNILSSSVISKTLNIETEDIVDSILKYKNKFQINLHMDYLTRPPNRGIKIIGEKGWLLWSMFDNKIIHYDYNQNKFNYFYYNTKYNFDQMYIRQLKYFINCIKIKKTSFSNIKIAKDILKIALNIKK